MGNISGRFANPDDWEYLLNRFEEQGKLFWLYINQRCDISGVHQLHYPVDTGYLGFQVNKTFIDDFLIKVNGDRERIRDLSENRLWLVEYVRLQQKPKGGPLSEKSGPHIKVVRELKKHGIFKNAVKKDPGLYENYTPPPKSNKVGYKYPNDSLQVDMQEGHGNGHCSGKGKDSGKGEGGSNGSDNPIIDEADDDIPEEELFGKPSLQSKDREQSAADFERNNLNERAKGTVFEE